MQIHCVPDAHMMLLAANFCKFELIAVDSSGVVAMAPLIHACLLNINDAIATNFSFVGRNMIVGTFEKVDFP